MTESTASTRFRTSPEDTANMPSGIPFIIGNEAAERFSYYGMNAILFLFMTKYLTDARGASAFMNEQEAKAWIHTFKATNYFFPILGAAVADVFLGKYLTIMSLSLVYCAGHLVLALLDSKLGIDPRVLLGGGLFLIALGSGGIKPCVSSHVGDQFGERNKDLIQKVFGWFYFSINFGSFLSTLLCPWLLANPKYGPAYAFGIPGIVMAIATLTFWLGRYRYAHIPAGGQDSIRETLSPDGLRALKGLIPLFLCNSVFFSLLDQTSSSWIEQARRMDRVVNVPLWGKIEINESQIQAINPILVMTLIPLLALVVFPLLGKLVTPLRKIGTGMFLIALSFAMAAVYEIWLDAGQSVHFYWQLAAYVVLTTAEVICYGTALEFSYTQAPPKMKSLIMGLFLLSISLGNALTAGFNLGLNWLPPESKKWFEGPNYYWFFTGCMLATAFAYLIWSPFYRGQVYLQGEADSSAA